MARIRTLKPDFWAHPKVARVSRDARLLFVGLITQSDDEGRQVGSPKLLAGVLYPHDEDVTAAKVSKWFADLERVNLARWYRVAGVQYVHLPGFTEHQKISHPTPSRLPAPDTDTPELFGNGSGEGAESFGPDLGTGRGRGSGGGSSAPATKIPDPFTTTDAMALWFAKNFPTENIDFESEKFLDHYRSNGETRQDWEATWRNWMRKTTEFRR